MNIILASTSTLFGGKYLEYLREELVKLYHGIDEVLFIPYARPSGISHEEYTDKAREFFGTIGIKIKGIHEFENPQEAIASAKAYFTGGGNTFLLVKNVSKGEQIIAINNANKNGTTISEAALIPAKTMTIDALATSALTREECCAMFK